jgi:hypothetical protein
MFEGGLALGLKGDDDKTDEDVHHEEGNDDDVDEVEECNNRSDNKVKLLTLAHMAYFVVSNLWQRAILAQ